MLQVDLITVEYSKGSYCRLDDLEETLPLYRNFLCLLRCQMMLPFTCSMRSDVIVEVR